MAGNKKVYLVCKGSYSDYHVVAAFSTKEKAEVVAKLIEDDYDTGEVEEYDLDPASADDTRPLWRVLMALDNGDFAEAEQVEAEYAIAPLSWFDKDGPIAMGPYWKGHRGAAELRMAWQVRIRADSAEAAIKIANERRAMYLANKGVDNERDA